MRGTIVENIRQVKLASSKTIAAHYFRRAAKLSAMPYNSEQRRQALRNFMKAHNLQPKAWARAAGLSEGALWPFLGKKNNPTAALGDDTYEALADAASEILALNIRAAQLREEAPWTAEIKIGSYVGAGDEVQMVGVDGGLGTTPAPPGFEGGGAVIVRGDSMRPVFDNGDLLFFRQREAPTASNAPTKPVIVEVRGGAMYVKKVLKGSKRGHFHLLSINPVTPVMEDRPIQTIARIGWVKPAE